MQKESVQTLISQYHEVKTITTTKLQLKARVRYFLKIHYTSDLIT